MFDGCRTTSSYGCRHVVTYGVVVTVGVVTGVVVGVTSCRCGQASSGRARVSVTGVVVVVLVTTSRHGVGRTAFGVGHGAFVVVAYGVVWRCVVRYFVVVRRLNGRTSAPTTTVRARTGASTAHVRCRRACHGCCCRSAFGVWLLLVSSSRRARGRVGRHVTSARRASSGVGCRLVVMLTVPMLVGYGCRRWHVDDGVKRWSRRCGVVVKVGRLRLRLFVVVEASSFVVVRLLVTSRHVTGRGSRVFRLVTSVKVSVVLLLFVVTVVVVAVGSGCWLRRWLLLFGCVALALVVGLARRRAFVVYGCCCAGKCWWLQRCCVGVVGVCRAYGCGRRVVASLLLCRRWWRRLSGVWRASRRCTYGHGRRRASVRASG